MASLSAPLPPDRASALAALERGPLDVLVIGGGITGAGVARDAVMRGLRVALVEQDDFASGTSSRSSRLVHGGVRYLEHGELALVFESSHERSVLLRIAPHLVRPLAFTWPVYAGARVRSWQLAAALTLYDALALFRNVSRHHRLSARAVLAREPAVRSADLLGGAVYWDAATDDARLTLTNAVDAAERGAVVINHARVEELQLEGGRVCGALVRDTETGALIGVPARVVVNATGPWSDAVERLAGAESAETVRGSKGVHILVPRERVGNVAALTLLAPSDGRVMFALPAGEFAIIGTTDTFEAVSPEAVRACSADVDYLLDAANHFFPAAKLTRADVISAWAGLRPLAAAGSADDPGSASREHTIAERVPGLVSVTGGKLTTYRVMARQVVNRAMRSLGEGRRRSIAARAPLPGGAGFDEAHETRAALGATGDARVAERLVHAHGTRWRAVWSLTMLDHSLRRHIDESRPYVLAELRWAVEREMARTLGDLLIRRIPLAFETRDHGCEAARLVAPRVAEWMGWSASRVSAEIERYDAEVGMMFGGANGSTGYLVPGT